MEEHIVLPDIYPLHVINKLFYLRIHIDMKTYPKTNRKRIVCSIPFPEDYPRNDFYRTVSEMSDENPQRIATLNLLYDTDKNSLEIAIFYVYSAFSNIKPHVTKEEQLQLKGLGVFMLCKVLNYLIEKIRISPETTVTLAASGDQCYDIEAYKDYTIEDCLKIINQYPYALWLILVTTDNYKDELIKLIQTQIDDGTIESNVTINNLYKTRPEILYIFITKYVEENPDKIIILRILVCKIITNQRLIEHNYKRIYNFDVDVNLGTEATMSGTVLNILSACKNRLGNFLSAFGIKKLKNKKSVKKSAKKRS